MSQRKYHTTEKECLAVILGIENFRPYIEGSHFTVITDHHSLLWLKNLKDPSGRLARWCLRLQAYDFDMIHRKGKDHVMPDALSRSVMSIDIGKFAQTTDSWYQKMRTQVEENSQMHDNLRLKKGVIYKRCKVRSPTDLEWKACVPKDCREEVVKLSHDGVGSGHFGLFKTLNKIKRYYVWPKMNGTVANHLKKCEICRTIKPVNFQTKPPMGNYHDPKSIFRVVATDIVGPFPLSHGRSRFILVAICVMSKYVIMRSVTQATAKEVVSFLREDVFYKFATPQKLISDNGVQYKSKIFADFLAKEGVEHWLTANYFPQANCTEAVNKTIGNAIKSFIENEFKHRDWDIHLQEIANAINNSHHTSTNETPKSIVFGQLMPQHGSAYDNFIDKNKDVVREPSHFEKIREQVRMHLKMAYERTKKRYDLRTRHIPYEIGDVVYRENMKLSDAGAYYSAKLAPRKIKSKIVGKTGTNTYLLEDCDTGKTGVYHAEKFHH